MSARRTLRLVVLLGLLGSTVFVVWYRQHVPIVILDKLGHFAGTAPIARIFLAAPEQHMSELKTEPLVWISADAHEKDVFELFDKYNLRMLTVLDHDQRPIGVITVDDVVSRLVNA